MGDAASFMQTGVQSGVENFSPGEFVHLILLCKSNTCVFKSGMHLLRHF
jgi:hypothetical protein